MTSNYEKSLEPFYFAADESDILEGNIKYSPITSEYIENYPSLVDRFFTRFYYQTPDKEEEDFQVLFHSNRVCLIALSPNHISLKKGVQSISFDIGNTDRSKNQVKGKGKKGGMVLQEDSTLALITCCDDTTYKIPSCVRGKLIEVNDRIVQQPNLLNDEGNGYIAIVLIKPENVQLLKERLLTEAQYKAELQDIC